MSWSIQDRNSVDIRFQGVTAERSMPPGPGREPGRSRASSPRSRTASWSPRRRSAIGALVPGDRNSLDEPPLVVEQETVRPGALAVDRDGAVECAAIDVPAAAGQQSKLRMPHRSLAGPMLLEHLGVGARRPDEGVVRGTAPDRQDPDQGREDSKPEGQCRADGEDGDRISQSSHLDWRNALADGCTSLGISAPRVLEAGTPSLPDRSHLRYSRAQTGVTERLCPRACVVEALHLPEPERFVKREIRCAVGKPLIQKVAKRRAHRCFGRSPWSFSLMASLLPDLVPVKVIPRSPVGHFNSLSQSYWRCQVIRARSGFPNGGPSIDSRVQFLIPIGLSGEWPAAVYEGMERSLCSVQNEAPGRRAGVARASRSAPPYARGLAASRLTLRTLARALEDGHVRGRADKTLHRRS